MVRPHSGYTSNEAEATAPPAMEAGRNPMVDTAGDILTVNPERSGKSDSRLPTRPGWFHRCRHTGELLWVPASAVPDGAQGAPAAHGRPDAARPVEPGAVRSILGG